MNEYKLQFFTIISKLLRLYDNIHYFWKVLDIGFARRPTDRALFHAHNTFGDGNFAAARPRVWNIPAHLRDKDTYNSFRHELKTY